MSLMVAYWLFRIEHMNDIWPISDRLAEVRAGLASVVRVLDPGPGRSGQFGDVIPVPIPIRFLVPVDGASGVGDDGGQFEDAGRIDAIRALEDLKNAACAAQVVLAVGFARSQRAEQARRGVPVDRGGRGVAEQVALARRESPHAGAVFLGVATMLVAEMPRTLAAMSQGVLSEYRARVVVQESACLTRQVRGEIDERVCGDLARLESLGTKRLGNLVRGEAARRDPAAVVARFGYAAEQRFVSLRPAPDCMARLTALVPVAQGVSVLAALTRAADAARAGGDPRSRGQVMADELVIKVTGQTSPDAVPVALHLVMPADLLLAPPTGHATGTAMTITGHSSGTTTTGHAGADTGAGGGDGGDGDGDGGDVARIVGYGPIPAPLARRLVAAAPRLGSWIRRLYAAPAGGLVARESRRRLFPKGLAEFITIRDDLCRTPFCDAPIRHIDHILPHTNAGPTTATNGQGLCERCNHAKQAPGWAAQHQHADANDRTHGSIDPTGGKADARSATQQQHASVREGDGQVTRARNGTAQGRRKARRRTHPSHEVVITTPTGHHYASPAPNSP